MLPSAFVGTAFEARPTVVMSAVCMAGAEIIVRPSEDTVRPKKAKKPTARPKTVADTD